MVARTASLLATVLAVMAFNKSPAAAGPAPAASFAATATASVAEGEADLDVAVGCFRSEARLPSFAHIAHYPATGEAIYRLRFDGLHFETIRFVRAAAGGTRAEIQLAGSYSRAERAHFAAARGAALAACLARPTIIAASDTSAIGTGL